MEGKKTVSVDSTRQGQLRDLNQRGKERLDPEKKNVSSKSRECYWSRISSQMVY